MRAVLDSNVIIRALLNPGSTWGQLLARTDYAHISTEEIVGEVTGVLARRHLQERLGWASETPTSERLREIVARIEIIEEPPVVPVCRDPKDDKFFACALAGAADYIVSEDDDILAIPEYEGIRTVRAAAFLRLLDEARS